MTIDTPVNLAMTPCSPDSEEMTADQAFNLGLRAASDIDYCTSEAAAARTCLREIQAEIEEIKNATKKKYSDPESEFYNKVIAQQDKLISSDLADNPRLVTLAVVVRQHQEAIDVFDGRVSALKARVSLYAARVHQQGGAAEYLASENILEAAKITGRKVVTIHNHA